MRSPLRRAFAVSTALHLTMLPLLLALLAAPSTDLTTNFAPERVTVASQRITIEPRRVVSHRVRSSTERSASTIARDRVRTVLANAPHATSRSVMRASSIVSATHRLDTHVAPQTLARSVPPRAPTTTVASTVATSSTTLERPHPAAAERSDSVATQGESQAAPTSVAGRTNGAELIAPTATPAPLPTATPGAQVAAVGGWGQNFDKPIVADEAALAELRHRYRLATSVSVAVDQSGHAMRVSMPANVPPDVRERLERELLALRYVPAECNGLRCEGTAALDL